MIERESLIKRKIKRDKGFIILYILLILLEKKENIKRKKISRVKFVLISICILVYVLFLDVFSVCLVNLFQFD